MTNNSEQLSLINEQPKADNTTVVCLGMTFENEEARREYFSEELRKKLPELKKIDGYPIGEDEDIIALSDPPYYTACPNPWINEFIEKWEKEKIGRYDKNLGEEYHRGPFSADVSEGKSDKIYNVHSYHTKVPHKAVMRYILHYTNPGDIVMDGFSGTGMTGVAARYCSDKSEVEKLGYLVDSTGNIIDEDGEIFSRIGVRNTILSDLSPTATLISHSYNTELKNDDFEKEAKKIMQELEEEYSWMFETTDDNHKKFPINYMVWSDNFVCPYCQKELIFWDISVDVEEKNMLKEYHCTHCNAQVNKRELEIVFTHQYDSALDKVVKVAKQTPVLINYTDGKNKINKVPDKFDYELQGKIENIKINGFVPISEIPQGDKTEEPRKRGIKFIHQFYTKRNLIIMSSFCEKIKHSKYKNLFLNIMRSSCSYSNRMVKVNIPRLLDKGGIFSFGFVSGTFYIPSLNGDRSMLDALKSKMKNVISTIDDYKGEHVISNQSTSSLSNIKPESIDYIFIDPPFGANLMYSELNFLSDSWLGVYTNNYSEAIINKTQNKNLLSYQNLMLECFKELHRILKPNRWITIEFSNSKASVWNAIREALEKSGFVIANVSSLDKKQGSFNAITSTTAVKQDLVISAYKPTKNLKNAFEDPKNISELPWIFVQNHISNLALPIVNKNQITISIERTPRILFDRMIAYHVQNGLPVPISSAEFQLGVTQRFPMRDGMAFLESQIAEYDKKRILVKDFSQISLFVSDENSAIEWIRQQLMKKPQTRQDLHSQFMKEIQHIAKHEQLPELDDLLVQNFLRYEGDTAVPDQIAGYLRRNYHEYRGLDNDNDKLKVRAMNCWYVPDPNKQADLEKLREKTLLREFESYVEELGTNKKKLSHFRTEAVRAGFKKAWTEKDYNKIVTVGDRLPETVIQEDDKLLMYYDNAQIRIDM
ncbi:DNA methyltransferase [Trichococcus alkaliphilus]|uniref:DNA methyltransferase n=1 Tax=Trichococcus alkaliphilus TaxID=2052943 RepID=UPI000D0BA3F0|nr:DNA methyltransferase [Trichococcus alkaliphilus]